MGKHQKKNVNVYILEKKGRHSMACTIKDVSRLSGVSTATVSRVFTTPERVSEGTRKKVLEVTAALNYQPNAIARSMVLQQSEKISFLICKKKSSILDEFYAGICGGIMEETNKSTFQLLISTATDWAKAKSKQVDGVILGGDASLDLISEFQKQNVKIVLVNHEIPGLSLPCIVSNEEQGVRLAIEHFIGKGHTKIAMLVGRFSAYISERRYNTFKTVMNEHDLPVPPSYIRMVDPVLEDSVEAATALLSQKDRPTAIFGANDVIAAGIVKAALRMKLRIPQDVAVIGCDDSKICEILEPELTTIHISCSQMGKLAARMLLSLLAGKPVDECRTVLDEHLVIRHST